ncbi:MAG: ABC transporter substrate-binding protein [Actinobacteria bacterium]|nr:ABC transporter substrate-binding protein [Actinomycetota bacterium]MCZ6739146.1 ABC transporter substrate-binding protein [Actinomycetota bacterium]
MKKRWPWLIAMLAVMSLVAAACATDEGASTTTAAETTETTAAETTETTAAETTETTAAEMDLSGTTVTVFGSESSDEEAGAMQDALDVFAEANGMTIVFTGARDFSDQINAQAAGGNPPDIAIIPQPGKVADFAREGFILPLPDDVLATLEENWDSAWVAFGNVDGVQYGVNNKSDIKSLVWYSPSAFADNGYTIPESWDALKALSAQMVTDGNIPWCVGIESGGATGWPFTDWIEDLTLRFEGADYYDQWVAHDVLFSDPAMVAIWDEVLTEWNAPGNVFAIDGSIAATAFGANGQPLADGTCMMHRQASFFSAFLPEGTPTGPDGISVFYFPAGPNGEKPVLGGGTLATAFRDAPEVWAVMKYYASAEYANERQKAQQIRKGGELSGFLSANQNQDLSNYLPLEQEMISIMLDAEVLRFDGSDLMPAAVGAGTFWTEGTSAVNGDKSVADAVAAIDASWP